VFGGAGWVLFRKRRDDFEVWNDFNSDLVNLYRVVKSRPEELIAELDWSLNSREDFKELKRLFSERTEMPDIVRAANYFKLIKYSYGSKGDSFSGSPRTISNSFPTIRGAHVRLDGVVIENKDFEALLRQYDRGDAFFYLDPPYLGTEDYYSGVDFGRGDHVRLRDALTCIEGKFLLSYNDCPEIRELYKEFQIEGVSRLSNLSQRFEGGTEYPELFIANYDMSERGRANEQLQFDVW
jgi:DNA adenine methylase